jgi:hypothetical protein
MGALKDNRAAAAASRTISIGVAQLPFVPLAGV